MNNFFIRGAILCTGLVLSLTVAAETLVEVTLVDKLDDERGYCLDIMGGKRNARIEDGMQAHTCYSYQGELGIDQVIDADQLPEGEIHLAGFDVCATAGEAGPESNIALKACDGSDAQKFTMTAAGTIESIGVAGMCMTVAAGESSRGNQGRSSHLIRSLTLEACSEDRAAYQVWRTRTAAD